MSLPTRAQIWMTPPARGNTKALVPMTTLGPRVAIMSRYNDLMCALARIGVDLDDTSYIGEAHCTSLGAVPDRATSQPAGVSTFRPRLRAGCCFRNGAKPFYDVASGSNPVSSIDDSPRRFETQIMIIMLLAPSRRMGTSAQRSWSPDTRHNLCA